MSIRLRFCLFLTLLLIPASAAAGAQGPIPLTSSRFTYSNPLPFQYESSPGHVQTEVRDPCILREGDTYYTVFTMWPFANREETRMGLPDNGSSPGIRLYASKNLKTWRDAGWLVKSSDLPLNSPYKHRFWSPEIHKINGKFYLIFTADNWLKPEYNPAGNWGTAGYAFVGVADKVTGPYRHITYIPQGACDTTLFGDADGTVYAVMPKYDIHIRRIDLSGLGRGQVRWLCEERKIVDCKSDDIPFAPDPEYLEGPWMEKIGAKYYLFYAELFRDPRAPGYWTGVAYADSPLGPWKKDPRGQVFQAGHLAVFNGPDGRKWFSYRVEDRDKGRGRLAIDPIGLNAQGRVETQVPSQTPQTVPSTQTAHDAAPARRPHGRARIWTRRALSTASSGPAARPSLSRPPPRDAARSEASRPARPPGCHPQRRRRGNGRRPDHPRPDAAASDLSAGALAGRGPAHHLSRRVVLLPSDDQRPGSPPGPR